MPTRRACAFLFAVSLGFGLPAAAQTEPDPLSAIDWLSDVVRNPEGNPPATGDIATSATPAQVRTMPLGQIRTDAVGVLRHTVSGLPADFWGPSSTAKLQKLILAQRTDLPAPLAGFLRQVMLTELIPPTDSGPEAGLFLARVDKFLDLGALDQARALLEAAGPDTPQLFRRWFDVSLLMGRAERACRQMVRKPDIAPTYPARIFCLAREGDWDAAALTLRTGQLLGVVSASEEALLARFLDPELFEGEPPLPAPERLNPLAFVMHDALGEPLALSTVPNAFAFASLDSSEGWKTRITAAERLARTGAITPAQLLAIYTERAPAASGGVWDRVEALQEFEDALSARDIDAISAKLPVAMRAMRRAGLVPALADLHGSTVASLPLEGEARFEAARLALLSQNYETIANSGSLPEDTPALWLGIARGEVSGISSDDPIEQAILAAFTSPETPREYDELLSARKLGEAALRAIIKLQDGALSDPIQIEQGLSVLRALSLEDLARRTALHILITKPRR